MKQLSALLSFLVLITISSNAQIKKGSTLLGLDIGFGSSTYKSDYSGTETKSSSSGFNSSLTLGKAVKENLFIGGRLSFATNKTENISQAKQTSKLYGVSVWSRKYFPVSKTFYAFVDGSVYGNIGNNNINGSSTKTNTFGTGISIYPGVSLQLTKSFYLDASLNNLANIYYNHSSGKQPNGSGGTITETSNNYGFSTSLGNNNNPLQLGMKWIF